MNLAQSLEDDEVALDEVEDAIDDDEVSGMLADELDGNELEDDDEMAEDDEFEDDGEQDEDDEDGELFDDLEGFEDDEDEMDERSLESDPTFFMPHRRRYFPYYRHRFGLGCRLGLEGCGLGHGRCHPGLGRCGLGYERCRLGPGRCHPGGGLGSPLFHGESDAIDSEDSDIADDEDYPGRMKMKLKLKMKKEMRPVERMYKKMAYKILGANQICFAIKALRPAMRKRIVTKIVQRRLMKMPARRRKFMMKYMKMRMYKRRRPCRPTCQWRRPAWCRRGYKKQALFRRMRYQRLRSYLMRMILQGRMTAMPLSY